MSKKKTEICGVCDPPEYERNHYFYGKLMTVRDFCQEQEYFNEKRRLVNRMVLGWGFVCGLGVCRDGDKLIVQPGLAIDCCGREILVCEEQKLYLPELEKHCHGEPQKGRHKLVICLEYDECQTEPVHLPAIGCGHTEEKSEYNRIRDHFKITIKPWDEACLKRPYGEFCYLDEIKEQPHDAKDRDCCTPSVHKLLCRHLKHGCPECEECECVVLAVVTIEYPPYHAPKEEKGGQSYPPDPYRKEEPYGEGDPHRHDEPERKEDSYQRDEGYRQEDPHRKGATYRQDEPGREEEPYREGDRRKEEDPYHKKEEDPYKEDEPRKEGNPHREDRPCKEEEPHRKYEPRQGEDEPYRHDDPHRKDEPDQGQAYRERPEEPAQKRYQEHKHQEPEIDLDCCTYRRLVYRNPLLYDLIDCHHGDLPHIVDFGWRRYTHPHRKIDWPTFVKLLRKKRIWVAFDRPMDPSSLNRHTFYLQAFVADRGTGHLLTKRIPCAEVVYEEQHGCHYATLCPAPHWMDDELDDHRPSELDDGIDVEITLRGDGIVDRQGKALDADFIGYRLPTGNGTQGGDFCDWFCVEPRRRSRKGYDEEAR